MELDGVFLLKEQERTALRAFLCGQHWFARLPASFAAVQRGHVAVTHSLMSPLAPILNKQEVRLAGTNIIGLLELDESEVPKLYQLET